MANRWFLAFHLIGLFIYMGGLLNLSRMLGYHVKESAEVRARLSWMEKRMYFFVTLPGLAIALIFGLLMFLGVGASGEGLTTGQAIQNYLVPSVKDAAGNKLVDANGDHIRSAWYVTFHLKLFLVATLIASDIYLGRQIVMLARGGEPPHPRRFKILHGVIALHLVIIVILMIAGPLKGG